jgi:hypothetical protein
VAQASHERALVVETNAFSHTSIEEVDYVASTELEQFDLEAALIESFKQSFPLRERERPVRNGGWDSYG